MMSESERKRALEEHAADERYRLALKSINEFAELCGQQQANITSGLEQLERVLEQKSMPDFERGWPIPKGNKR